MASNVINPVLEIRAGVSGSDVKRRFPIGKVVVAGAEKSFCFPNRVWCTQFKGGICGVKAHKLILIFSRFKMEEEISVGKRLLKMILSRRIQLGS
jgi:hypothetical protein